jgi:hypothetical protein
MLRPPLSDQLRRSANCLSVPCCIALLRKCSRLAGASTSTTSMKLRVKLSAEIRLLEGSLARLLKQIKTDVPEADSRTTVKARRVARARWDRVVSDAGA